ncbi:MAG: hypothetical protein PHD23_06545 [Eubacteriales bacterium]|nr:hypothetical protein [Eubacteriales bacterium]
MSIMMLNQAIDVKVFLYTTLVKRSRENSYRAILPAGIIYYFTVA